MNIFIFGGTGLIGQAFCRHAMLNNHTPVIVSRNPAKYNTPYKMVSYSEAAQPAIHRLMSGEYAVVNLTGAGIADTRWTKERKTQIYNSRIDLLNRIELFLQQAPQEPDVFIQASAIGFYGDKKDVVVGEKGERGEGFLAELAEKWEDKFLEIGLEDTRKVIIRTGVVLSGKGGMLPRAIKPFKLFVGGHLGSGKQYLSWIHMEDQLRAMLFLIENSYARGVFNLTAPNPVTMKRFSKILGKVLQKPSFFPVPGIVLKALFGQMAKETLLQGVNASSTKLVEHEFEFIFYDLESALRSILEHPDSKK